LLLPAAAAAAQCRCCYQGQRSDPVAWRGVVWRLRA
jgi:hypothetical protein